MNDLKSALRQLLKNRGLTSMAGFPLALRIEANTAIFSLQRLSSADDLFTELPSGSRRTRSPQFNSRIPGSTFARSPTTTQTNLSGSMTVSAAWTRSDWRSPRSLSA